MQAVILAAGEGRRMRPLTESTPKPLLEVCGRPLISYTFAALPDVVDEVVMVVSYLKEKITAYLGSTFEGRKIHYVEQRKLEGTGKALFEARPLIKDRFLVLMADDIYFKEDIERCVKFPQAMLVKKSDLEESGGKVSLSEAGGLLSVEEGDAFPSGTLVGTNVFVLPREFFNYQPVKKATDSKEYGLPQTVVEMSKCYPVSIVEAKKWIKITSPEDLKKAEKLLQC